MQSADVYLMYCALKAHFKGDYDYHKFSGQTKIKRDSYYKRKDRIFFVKTAYKYKKDDEVLDYFVSNFIQERDGYIANFNEQIFITRRKYINSSPVRGFFRCYFKNFYIVCIVII